MSLPKGFAKYIIVTTFTLMGLLLLIGPIYFYLLQDPNFFSAFIPTLGIMLCLKGKIADTCFGNRDKHKPRYGLGSFLIIFTIAGGYASVTADKARGAFEQHSLAYLLDRFSYSLTVEYVSLLIIAPIVLIIVNLIKFLKKKTKATNVELGNEQSQVETPDVSADIIEVIPSEELALQTPPPVTCVSDDLPQENDNNQATDNEEAASNDNSVYPTPPPIPSISEGMPQQSEANIDAGNEDDEPNDSSLIETHPSENQDCTAVGVSEGEGKENSIQEEDKFTKLYRAISPANFLEPYSPEKVKLANELLEALIKNKDNEVVISLIEEKAKEKLGVTISD